MQEQKCAFCGVGKVKAPAIWCSRRCAGRAAVKLRNRWERGEVDGRIPYPCRKCAQAEDCNFMCLGYRLWFADAWSRMQEGLK